MSSFQFALYDHDGVRQHLFDTMTVQQLRYEHTLNSYGILQFTIRADLMPELLRTRDSFFQILRDDGTGSVLDATFMILGWQYLIDQDIEYCVVAGVGLEHLFYRRIFVAEDDPLVANGYSTKSGAADLVMSAIVQEQCVSPVTDSARGFPRLYAGASVITGLTVGFREASSNKKVLEILQTLAKAGGLDFWVEVRSDFSFLFRMDQLGSDKRVTDANLGAHNPTLVLSFGLGTIIDPDLTISLVEEANMVYVFGQGQPGQRLLYKEGSFAVTESPWARSETALESSSATTLTELSTEARDELKQQIRSRRELTCTLPATLRYKQDYVLGDQLSVLLHDERFDFRIVGIQIDLSNELETITSTLEYLDL